MQRTKEEYILEETIKDLITRTREGCKAWELLKAAENNIVSKGWSIPKIGMVVGYAQCLMVAGGTITLDEVYRIIRMVEDSLDDVYNK